MSLLELEFHSFVFAKGKVQVIFTNDQTYPEKGNSKGEEKNGDDVDKNPFA